MRQFGRPLPRRSPKFGEATNADASGLSQAGPDIIARRLTGNARPRRRFSRRNSVVPGYADAVAIDVVAVSRAVARTRHGVADQGAAHAANHAAGDGAARAAA